MFPLFSEVISSVRKSFLTPEVWECEDKDEEKRLLTTFRRSAMDSAVIVSKNQDDLNGTYTLMQYPHKLPTLCNVHVLYMYCALLTNMYHSLSITPWDICSVKIDENFLGGLIYNYHE